MKDVPLSQAKQVYNFVKIASSVSQDYYPEMLGNMLIVNAPFLFSGAWTLVKPLIDKRTREKIAIKGSSFQSELFQMVDPANLPTFLGGTCECPNGCLNTNPGPWNPLNLSLDITGSIIYPEKASNISEQNQEDSEKQQQEYSSEEEQNIEELKQALKGFQQQGMRQNQMPQQDLRQQSQSQQLQNVELQFPSLTPLNTMVEEEAENQNL